jgi:hypothetical protein
LWKNTSHRPVSTKSEPDLRAASLAAEMRRGLLHRIEAACSLILILDGAAAHADVYRAADRLRHLGGRLAVAALEVAVHR